MVDMVTISREEHERLLAEVEQLRDQIEDLADAGAMRQHLADVENGDVFLLSDNDVGRILDGESSLRVVREARGLSQMALAEMSNVGRSMINQIEHGVKSGSIDTVKALATALRVSIDDIV